MSFNSYNPKELSRTDIHQLMIGCISPRPIALVSSLDQNGNANLAPYSFFNAISSNPPMICFSVNVPNSEKEQKDSYLNISSTRECVVNLVNHAMHRQMTLCSINYPAGVSEFSKSGLSPLRSECVSAPRVKESPVHLECTVHDILVLGKHEGASNLIICTIEKMHIDTKIITEGKLRIDPQALDIMGRLGRSNYVRVKGDNIMEVYQSTNYDCIAYDGLPESIRTNHILSANDIAELASCKSLPDERTLKNYLDGFPSKEALKSSYFFSLSAKLIREKNKEEALICAMIPEYLNNV